MSGSAESGVRRTAASPTDGQLVRSTRVPVAAAVYGPVAGEQEPVLSDVSCVRSNGNGVRSRAVTNVLDHLLIMRIFLSITI